MVVETRRDDACTQAPSASRSHTDGRVGSRKNLPLFGHHQGTAQLYAYVLRMYASICHRYCGGGHRHAVPQPLAFTIGPGASDEGSWRLPEAGCGTKLGRYAFLSIDMEFFFSLQLVEL